MSVDHSVSPFRRQEGKLAHVFLSVKAGMTVICGSTDFNDWWMADVIYVDGGARDPKVNSLFQVPDVDTGVVRWINADEVNEVLWSMDGWGE